MKKIILLVMVLAVLSLLWQGTFQPERADAAGDIVLNLGAAAGPDTYRMNWFDATVINMYEAYHKATADGGAGGTLAVGWAFSTTTSNHITPYSNKAYGWDTSAIPAGAVVKAAWILVTPSVKIDTYVNYNDFYWSFFATNPGADNTWTVNDNSNTSKAAGRETAPHHYNSLVVGTAENVTLANPSYVTQRWNGTNKIWLSMMLEVMTYPNGYDPLTSGEANGNTIRFDCNAPVLYVRYTPPATVRAGTLHVNAATVPPTGTDGADNITLETLSCMYGDESLSFFYNGTPGNGVYPALYDKDGNILATSNNQSIRTDGIYAYQPSLSTSYSGFVRAKDESTGLYSPWVSVQPSPASTELSNSIYALSTAYPQYSVSFSSYVVNVGDLLYFHWKTNISPSEIADYSLKIYANGDNTSAYFNMNLADMANSYFLGTLSQQQNKIPWRYAVFALGYPAGFQDYAGLVINLNMESANNYGFVEPMITDNSSIELVTPVSAYWYLTDASYGLSMSTDRLEYATGDPVSVLLNVGDQCQVERYLAFVQLEVVGSVSYYYTAVKGDNLYTPGAFNNAASPTIRVHLFDATRTSYQYIFDLPFKVSGDSTGTSETPGGVPTAKGWWAWFKNLVKSNGLDNPMGHWLIIMALAVFLAIAFRKKPAVATGLVIMVFIAGFTGGWIDKWFSAALILGIGLELYGKLKKKTKASSST